VEKAEKREEIKGKVKEEKWKVMVKHTCYWQALKYGSTW